MKEEVNALNCGRENDLVAFLYGELNDVESQTFERHLQECPACSAELPAFGLIHESVVAWRNESLGGGLTRVAQEKPSALRALREFFNLSPLWMKGAVAFASLLFCLLAGLAIAHWQGRPPAAVATNPNSQAYSEEQLNALLKIRLQDELQRRKSSAEEGPASHAVVADNTSQHKSVPRAKHSAELVNNVTEHIVSGQKARRPLSRVERDQLAADLRLISSKHDGELELLDDKINQ
ncbi:MAG: zf-HC2 domain-containing protein [Acidobacteriota bacterium]|nr:zf-HC2 domain-containing protein [Acidobacteriota bacterium]